MAVPTNTTQTFVLEGIRDDLTDKIFDISPTSTPFVSGIKRSRAKQTFHEWQTDELAAVDLNNKHIEGDDSTATAITPTVRMGNYTQILKKVIRTSGTSNAVDTAGRKREHAYQLARKGQEMKRDLEAILLSNQGAAGGSAGVAATMGTLGAFVKTNTSVGATGSDPVYTNIPTDPRNNGTQRPLNEDDLKSVLQGVWSEGGEPSTIMAGAFNKGAVSGLTGLAQQTNEVAGSGRKIIGGGFDIYVSEWGTLKVVASRHQRDRDLWVLDYSVLELPVLRPMFTEELAKTGDSVAHHMIMETTFKVGQEKALGLVADLTTA